MSTVESRLPVLMSAKAANTQRTVADHWEPFSQWCKARGIERYMVSWAEVAQHLEGLIKRGLSPGTIHLRLYAITWHLKAAGRLEPFDSDTLKAFRARLRRQAHTQKTPQPFGVLQLGEVFNWPARRSAQLRDRALAVLMYVTGASATHVLVMKVADVRWIGDDAEVKIDGKKHVVRCGLTALCPVKALRAWMREGELKTGYLFPVLQGPSVGSPLHYKVVRDTLRKWARKLGMNPASVSASSLLEARKIEFNDTRALGL